jgi:hypothetical protein
VCLLNAGSVFFPIHDCGNEVVKYIIPNSMLGVFRKERKQMHYRMRQILAEPKSIECLTRHREVIWMIARLSKVFQGLSATPAITLCVTSPCVS